MIVFRGSVNVVSPRFAKSRPNTEAHVGPIRETDCLLSSKLYLNERQKKLIDDIYLTSTAYKMGSHLVLLSYGAVVGLAWLLLVRVVPSTFDINRFDCW